MEYYSEKLAENRKELKRIQSQIEQIKDNQKRDENRYYDLLCDLDICLDSIEKYSKIIERTKKL